MEAITARVKKIELQASSTPVSTKTKKSKTKNGIEGANEEKTKKKKKKHDKEKKEAEASPLPRADQSVNRNDDLDFWLSADNNSHANGKEKKADTSNVVTTDADMSIENSDKKKKKKTKDDSREKKPKKEKKASKGEERTRRSKHLSGAVNWNALVEDRNLLMVQQRYLNNLWMYNFEFFKY